MKTLIITFLIFVFKLSFAYSFENKSLTDVTNGTLLFRPLVAYTFEPRMGFINRLNTNNVRLDIGGTFDFTKFYLYDNLKIALGADFFTYTKLRKESDFKFPVETIDYLFGINCSFDFNNADKDFRLALRIRLSHISAHLVDGFADSNVFLKMPYVYSREFFDICFALKVHFFRVYVATDIIFHSIPNNFSTFNPHIGFDFHYPLSVFDLVGGYDFKLSGIDSKYYTANSAQLGLSYNFSSNFSLFFGFYYYRGRSIHGLFYKDYDDYFGIGFQIMNK